jgi:hypothetical protein
MLCPFVSYLYWTQKGSGIYRADLRPSSAGGAGVDGSAVDPASVLRVVQQKSPGPFIVDCLEYRLYYVSDTASSSDSDDDDDDEDDDDADGGTSASAAILMSADLDGSDPAPVRGGSGTEEVGDSSSSDWASLTGLARHRPTGAFYWSTAAGRLWSEEPDPVPTAGGNANSVYHQNEMPVDGKHFAGVNVWHSTSQPVPGN